MLNTKNFGLAGGSMWAIVVFGTTLIAMLTGYGALWAAMFADIYPFYDVTFFGSIIGIFWGFIDGFIGFFLLAWFYNKFNE